MALPPSVPRPGRDRCESAALACGIPVNHGPGDVRALRAVQAGLCALEVPPGSFDAVTLPVLEHIPDVAEVVRFALRAVRPYVVVSVPSKPDQNPEHIHLLTKDVPTELLSRMGAARLSFGGVNESLLLFAAVEKEGQSQL